MKIVGIPYQMILLTLLLVSNGCGQQQGNVEPVALPPNIAVSELYVARVNGVDLPVGHEISNDSVFETTAFTMEGKIQLEIEAKVNIDNYSIHPLSKNVAAEHNGKKLSFTIEEPSNLLVKINGQTPLLIFATPHEKKNTKNNRRACTLFRSG